MIKHNMIAGTGGGGIVMEGDGEAGVLVIENNQLLDVAREANVTGTHPAAIRVVRVGELDVTANAVHGFARDAQQAASRAGISTVAVASARITGNTLTGIAPAAGFVGSTAGIEIVPPFASVAIRANNVRRRALDEVLTVSAWTGVYARRGQNEGTLTGANALGDLAVVMTRERAFVFTATNVFVEAARVGDVTISGNDVEAEATNGAPAFVEASHGCRLTENRLVNASVRAQASRIRCRRGLVASNDLRNMGEDAVLEVELIDKAAAVIGNICTGPIILNGAPLPPVWAELNPIGA